MKKIIYYGLLIFFSPLYGQTTYQPIFINQCTGEQDELPYWYVLDETGKMWVDTVEMKSIILPEKDDYQLYLDIDERVLKFSIGDEGLKSDTFFIKRLSIQHYISNPPLSEYIDCGHLAQGKVVDYYYSGKVRRRGTFKNGQTVDSLITYYQSGAIDEIFIPNKKKWKRITFFEDGQMKSVLDTKKRYSKEYYWNGQLRKKSDWSKKYKSKEIEYYLSGALKVRQDDRKREIYNQKGILRERISRKEIFKMERIFALKSSYRKEKFYEYEWELFDEEGLLERKIIFNGSGFSMSPFPDDVEQIKNFLYHEIVFYKKGKEYRTINLRLDEEKTITTVENLKLYYQAQKKWMEVEN